MLSIFHVSVGDLYVLFGEMSIEGNSLTFSSAVWAMKQGVEIWCLVMVPRGCSGGANGKETACQRDAGSIPGSGRSLGGGHGHHSSIIAWIIPLSEEPDGPRSMDCKESDTTEWLTHRVWERLRVNLCRLDECKTAAMWIVCYSCCLSFKNRAVVTQLKPWACPAPRCPLPGWQHFLPGPRAFLPGLIAHKTWHSAGMHLRAIQGNRLLSASTNNCHRQNAVFISRHTLSFLGGINMTQKEQGKNPLSISSSFSLKF